MFRSLMILGVLAIAAFMAGWFTIHRDDNETTIKFNRDEIRSDTSKAIAKGRQILNGDNVSPGSSQDGQAVGDGFYDVNANADNTPTDYGAYPPPGTPNRPEYDARYNQSTQSASRPSPPWSQSR
ncbi:MAG: hypothetical protein AAF802_25640 [Planctomycetota bacterium]